ncbi:MAG: imidazole glycerol phosphate synthase subunit HisH [Candidatus Thermoplasmatota archaeon]
MTTWTVLDYGVGNLHSLAKALTAVGAKVKVTARPEDLAGADVAVLPGVGAFGAVMDCLAPAGMALRRRHADGRPTLGICIGAQVLYAASDETPGAKGLGIFPGTVRRLPASAGKVPHMGWNTLEPAPSGAASDNPSGLGLQDSLFEGVPAGSHVYYVHGYAAPVGPETVASTRYGTVFTAALRQGATVGVQFHPEKSSAVGRRILANAVRDLEAHA